jgi:hypothetical protein
MRIMIQSLSKPSFASQRGPEHVGTHECTGLLHQGDVGRALADSPFVLHSLAVVSLPAQHVSQGVQVPS